MKIVIAMAAVVLVMASARLAIAQVQTPQDRINTGIARAREVGIPVALLESKIAEGKAKGVSMERIAAAVERREAALERASQAMRGRPEVGAADLSVGADAIESGVSQAVLKAISETAPRDRRVVAIAALTELVRLGHVPEAALERVREALKRGPEALMNLPAEAAGSERRTGPPESRPGEGAGRGGGGASPPAAVPAPGGLTEPTRPGRSPETPSKPPTPSRGSV